MNPKWHFNPRRPCDRMRDSANDAFFTAESLENLSEALVREGIQNSLDAARRGALNQREVTVRIRYVASASPEVRDYLSTLFTPACRNFQAGLLVSDIQALLAPDNGFLVFEDFGTRGLCGDVEEWRLGNAEQNAFFSFFRAEGRSSKIGDSLGRWGIGKQVFPTASRLHAMIGLTTRSESPARVLMGSAVVRTHSVDGKDFQPDAWFGCREVEENPVMPVSDAGFIEKFARVFGLARGLDPGLSIVVPSVDDRVNINDLRRGVVRSFFWPILLGELIVEIEGAGGLWRIDAESLPNQCDLLPPSEAAVIQFAGWASTARPAEIVSLPNEAATRPDWRTVIEGLIPEAKIAEIRLHLDSRGRVGVKVPVRVRPKDPSRSENLSYFTVFVESCRDAGHRPIFLRDGNVITDIRSPQMSGNRALVVVDHTPLAGLLGDSEGVNHTQWQKDSPKFYSRYVYGPDTIKFVTRSVYEIMQRLHSAETKGDPTLLLDLFFLPKDDAPIEPTKKPKPKESGNVTDPGGGSETKPRRFEIKQVEGGFKLMPGNAPPEVFPIRVRIEAGYAIRRGNALKRWAADDFVFTRPPLRQEPKAKAVVTLREDRNWMELEIRQANFEFGMCGFDKRRDLVVRAVELRKSDEADV